MHYNICIYSSVKLILAIIILKILYKTLKNIMRNNLLEFVRYKFHCSISFEIFDMTLECFKHFRKFFMLLRLDF